MRVARFTDGDSVLFDRLERHDDKVLFFRSPVGLVHAKQFSELETIEDATDGKILWKRGDTAPIG